jgi:tetratricopeptide (TPR) repeat protein
MIAAIFGLLLASGPSAPPDQGMFFNGTGPHHRTVRASSKVAQRYFDQGLSFLFGFNHAESTRSFEAAAAADPKCAMAHWGIAMSQGPHINLPMVMPDQAKVAVAALRKADALAPKSGIERDLIAASMLRYRDPQPEDRSPLDRAYSAAMKRLWTKYPKDADVGALYAESLMDLRPWDQWKPDGTPQPTTIEVTQVVDEVLRLNPNHPMGLHLAIHAWEASPTPWKADAAADRLRNLQPALGHMVHMPSHIDVLRGRWEESILANEKAIAADVAYRKIRPRQGFYRLYMAHNRHMLGFSAMMVGQRAKAVKAMDEMVREMPQAFVKENAFFMDSFFAMPLEVRVRFGRWDEVLAAPAFPDHLPLAETLRHMARGVAFAAKGNVFEAEAEQMLFRQGRAKMPEGKPVGNSPATTVLDLADHLLQGEILIAKGDVSAAIDSLKLAVRAEEQLRYDEPPDWVLPTRHVLGVALLKAGKTAEAEKVYREDLKRRPNNGWSLQGLSDALARQGKSAEASKVRAQFVQAWKNADTAIESSCLCVPKP